MTLATLTKHSIDIAFPATPVEAKLREAMLEAIISSAALHGLALPDTTAGQYAAVVQIDSLCAVELLCEVEPIIGFELKDSIVRSGGYRSINEAISHVMPRIEAAWHKHAKKGAKK